MTFVPLLNPRDTTNARSKTPLMLMRTAPWLLLQRLDVDLLSLFHVGRRRARGSRRKAAEEEEDMMAAAPAAAPRAAPMAPMAPMSSLTPMAPLTPAPLGRAPRSTLACGRRASWARLASATASTAAAESGCRVCQLTSRRKETDAPLECAPVKNGGP